jgi:hypothetical protein
MEKIIAEQHHKLVNHPVYLELTSTSAIRAFMECHVFAVWDFMSLLKALQNKVTCTTIPWRPSVYSADVVRMINEIVLGEESDVDQYGNSCSHFHLYIRAMEEVGADTLPIFRFLETLNANDLPDEVKAFVEHNLETAKNGSVEEIAASFFYGREKLLPDVFKAILKTLGRDGVHCPTLTYYFERHIEVDGDSHGPLAAKCLEEICSGDSTKNLRAHYAGIQALRYRERLWDATLNSIKSRSSESCFSAVTSLGMN